MILARSSLCSKRPICKMATHRISLIVWIFISASLGNVWGQVILTPGTLLVDENNSVTLSCSYTGSRSVLLYDWTLADAVKGKVANSGCQPFNIIPDSSKYTYTCIDNKQMSWTIKNVDITNGGDIWMCEVTVQDIEGTISSNEVSIDIEATAIVSGQVTLSPGTVVVDENNPVTLTCTDTGTEAITWFTWYEVVGDVGGTDDINKGSIFPSGCTDASVDATKYTYSCPSNKQVTWTINNVDRTNNGDKWACSATVSSIIYSNGVSIGVSVPIQSVTMILQTSNATLDVVENTEQMFRCRTDGGLPVADITWYKDNGTPGDTSDDIKIQQNITPSKITDNGLSMRTSTLKFYPPRSDTDNRIYCSAKNIQGQTSLISTRKPLLNVLYPPSTPIIYYNTISDSPISVDLFDVVAGDSLPLACSADGQPEPNYTWLFDNKQLTGQNVVLSSIETDMVDTSIKCIARNQLKEIGSTTTVNMNIMYPPHKPTIRLKYGFGTYTSISDTFSVIEGTAFVLDCQGSSKPDPSYHWFGSGIQSSTEFHIPVDTTSRDSYNVYTCEVTNLMNRTYGSPSNQEGTYSTDVTANVLYGPVVSPMSNQSAEEGKSFRYNCPYEHGNPADTTVIWTQADGNITWNSEMFEIVNVSKNDKMKYICSVGNILAPTNQHPLTSRASGYFYLDVKYKASIEDFTAEGHTGREVTVEEFTSPTLVCNVGSNPASNIIVLFRNKILAEASNSFQLIHQISNVSCGDIGIYTCAGRNYLNTQTSSTRDIVLLVNCRPQPYGDIDNTVFTAQRTAAFLRMSVLAYPVTANVIWQKDETDLKNSEKLTMTSTFVKTNGIHIDIIQSHLIIYDVSVSDFGQYKVQIRNDVGMMEKIFYLKEQEPVESEQPKQNIGTIVGAFAGGAVFAGLVSIVVVAVVFLLRRRKATEERKSDNQQPIGLDQAGATKTTDDTSNHSNERPNEQMNEPSNNDAAYYNEGSVSEYQTLDEQHRDFMTYTSLQSDNNLTTEDNSRGENKMYENLALQAI